MKLRSYLLAVALAASFHSIPINAQVVASAEQLVQNPIVTLRIAQSVTSQPDTAEFRVGVLTTASNASQALAENSAKMESLVAAIRRAGIPANRVQTTGLNLNARYDYEPSGGGQRRLFRGYEVNNSVRVMTDDIAGLGKLMDTLVAAGGTSISGPFLSTSKADELRREARLKALAAADRQAADYASARGYSRARLISINESGLDSPVVIMGSRVGANSLAASPPPPIAPGEVSTGVSLVVQYVLEK